MTDPKYPWVIDLKRRAARANAAAGENFLELVPVQRAVLPFFGFFVETDVLVREGELQDLDLDMVGCPAFFERIEGDERAEASGAATVGWAASQAKLPPPCAKTSCSVRGKRSNAPDRISERIPRCVSAGMATSHGSIAGMAAVIATSAIVTP